MRSEIGSDFDGNKTMGHRLQEKGYTTVIKSRDCTPENQCFDQFFARDPEE